MEPMKNIPVYRHSAAYAVEHGELEAYKTSRVAGVACRDAIEKAVAKHYRDNCLNKAGAREVIDEFGKERVMTVLAITIIVAPDIHILPRAGFAVAPFVAAAGILPLATRNPLRAPRTLAGAVTIGRYIYLVGGTNGAGPTATSHSGAPKLSQIAVPSAPLMRQVAS